MSPQDAAALSQHLLETLQSTKAAGALFVCGKNTVFQEGWMFVIQLQTSVSDFHHISAPSVEFHLQAAEYRVDELV